MADLSCESLICSDLNTVMELVRFHGDQALRTEDIEDSIMIDGYKEIPTNKRLKRSSSAHLFYDTVRDNSKTLMKSFSSVYKKIATLFFVFNRFMLNNDAISNMPVVNNNLNSANSLDSINEFNDFRIKEKLSETVDRLRRCNRMATDRIVAMIPTVPVNLNRFKISKYFSPADYDFSDCFALFLEDIHDAFNPEGQSGIDDIPSSIKCKILSKKSQEVLSESGPYECLYEEQVNSINDDNNLSNVIYGMPMKTGRIKFFHRNVALHTNNSDGEGMKGGLRQRFMTMSEHLMRRGDTSCEMMGPKTYFNVFFRKGTDEDVDFVDEAARERFEEHIRMHTIRWDEVQYDDIEIVLRDDNDNSIVKLPYSCTIM